MNKKYCAFIDVLGYKGIVQSTTLSIDEKRKILSDIYMNLFGSISQKVKSIIGMPGYAGDLFIKSFSDCIYIESSDPYLVLFTTYSAFHITFTKYGNFSFAEKYTPLLRGGIVQDWTVQIMDIGALTKHAPEEIYTNPELKNIIGAGITRAYLTSEKSKISGMRIIVSEEVIQGLSLTQKTGLPFECYEVECKNFTYTPELPDPESINLFIIPFEEGVKCDDKKLFEICWAVSKHDYNSENSKIMEHIGELIKMQNNFSGENTRHLRETAKLLEKALRITVMLYPKDFTQNQISVAYQELNHLASIQ